MPTVGQPKYYQTCHNRDEGKSGEIIQKIVRFTFFPDQLPIKISIGGIKCLFKCNLALFVVPVVRRCHFI